MIPHDDIKHKRADYRHDRMWEKCQNIATFSATYIVTAGIMPEVTDFSVVFPHLNLILMQVSGYGWRGCGARDT